MAVIRLLHRARTIGGGQLLHAWILYSLLTSDQVLSFISVTPSMLLHLPTNFRCQNTEQKLDWLEGGASFILQPIRFQTAVPGLKLKVTHQSGSRRKKI
ncbi:hypothetical protein XELAEV_18018347mg [Xenopus laevis]|uniref:Uncharacterized protein n=1 Tax=Xenopus laevis TaxID=8355 RepID=A0A974DDE6_XENLA|nr:hypothetical protein XELAEV_18018347mg [Xenopus laevis]